MTLDEIVAEYENNVADLTTSERLLVWWAYETGLRRAQELAKKHVYAWGDEVDAEQGLCADIGVSFAAFDNAIDAEAKK